MPEAQARAAISDEEVSALLEKNGADAVRPYDFAAQRINRMQLPLLEVVSKSFAERAGASLSTLLGRDAAMQFTSLESAKSADLQAALPVPASLAVVRLKPLPGFAFVSVEPDLLLTLLDGFFGGSGRATVDPAAWAPVTPLELELVKQETNPRLVQLGAPLEALLVVKFTVEFGARSGRIDWLLPEALLAPVREALAADGGQTTLLSQEAWAPALTAALQDAELDTRAVLAQAQISLRELVRLSPGDIIPIEPPQQVTLYAGDIPLYRGRFGVSQGRNALKILSGVPT